jgi:hypothetical protein
MNPAFWVILSYRARLASPACLPDAGAPLEKDGERGEADRGSKLALRRPKRQKGVDCRSVRVHHQINFKSLFPLHLPRQVIDLPGVLSLTGNGPHPFPDSLQQRAVVGLLAGPRGEHDDRRGEGATRATRRSRGRSFRQPPRRLQPWTSAPWRTRSAKATSSRAGRTCNRRTPFRPSSSRCADSVCASRRPPPGGAACAFPATAPGPGGSTPAARA